MAMRGHLSAGLIVACALSAGTARPATAGCTLNSQARDVRRSIVRQIRCNDKRLRKGPNASCALSAPPACAGTLVADAVALADGDNNPASAAVDTHALREQLKCQKRIGRAVSS